MIETATYKTKSQAKNLTAHQMLEKLESMEFHGSMTPVLNQNDPIKILENIEINKSQVQLSKKGTTEKEMDNQAGIDLHDGCVHISSFQKTPASMIQEFATRRNIPCKFDLIDNTNPSLNNVYKYRLTLGDDQTVGYGTSKKSAKHQVALNMHNVLKQHNPRFIETEFKQIDFENPVDVCNNIKVNVVGSLSNLCVINNLGKPVYEIVREEGEPHTKLYTFSCQVAQMFEIASFKTKRQAKNLAAFQMLRKIESMEFILL
ncbi:Double-stranded RNA-binding domain [Cinara cedri]|uniref:Double-stranded RNA-binding domain n=1 Tax=Cinara cedri TaxID=506608 RepID=A0A5E4NB91_9HEMI|nr:Double-stranded RNA-binding domain [Cinara cedri]